MNKICTSIDQSKKLIELGIDVKTADMFWDTLFAKKPEAQVDNQHFIDEYDDEHRVPAWSLSALLNFIRPYGYSLSTSINNKIMITINKPHNLSLCFYDEPIDAAFEMIIRLKENGKL